MAEKDKTAGLDDSIRSEQLKLVYAQAPLAIIISPMAATTLAIGIWQVADHGSVIAWVVVLALLALLRIGLVVAFRRRQSALAMGVWARLFAYSFILVGLCWGLGGWLLLPEEFAYRVMIFFFMIGMASAAVAVY